MTGRNMVRYGLFGHSQNTTWTEAKYNFRSQGKYHSKEQFRAINHILEVRKRLGLKSYECIADDISSHPSKVVRNKWQNMYESNPQTNDVKNAVLA